MFYSIAIIFSEHEDFNSLCSHFGYLIPCLFWIWLSGSVANMERTFGLIKTPHFLGELTCMQNSLLYFRTYVLLFLLFLRYLSILAKFVSFFRIEQIRYYIKQSQVFHGPPRSLATLLNLWRNAIASSSKLIFNDCLECFVICLVYLRRDSIHSNKFYLWLQESGRIGSVPIRNF